MNLLVSYGNFTNKKAAAKQWELFKKKLLPRNQRDDEASHRAKLQLPAARQLVDVCFNFSWKHGTSDGHLNAANLNKIGVWLGDLNDVEAVVNGVSWFQVKYDYLNRTTGDANVRGDQLHVLDAYTNAQYPARCAACIFATNLKIQMLGLDVDEDDSEVHKSVS